MHKAHSKDINRNKSFHPNTYGNLLKVEKLKEAEELRHAQELSRRKELQRDQEERRYEELVLASSADGQSGQLARFQQVKNIFAAEYERDATAQEEAQQPHQATPSTSSSSAAVSRTAHPFGTFMSKFKQDPSATLKMDESCTVAEVVTSTAETIGSKRSRSEDSHETQQQPVVTGFVSTSEATKLRKELDLIKKQKLDPLRKVMEYQNRTVAAAARVNELKARHQETLPSEEQALRERIQALTALKKQR